MTSVKDVVRFHENINNYNFSAHLNDILTPQGKLYEWYLQQCAAEYDL